MERTWQDNATEFGALSKQGVDFRLAALVACSVNPNGKGGGDQQHRNVRYGAKASASSFARKAGTSAPRILRHLEAWDSVRGLTKSSKLSPNDVDDLELPEHLEVAFHKAYAGITASQPTGGRPRASRDEIVERARNDKEYAKGLVSDIAKDQPEAVAQGLAENSDVPTLSRATAAAARNRQVERNRARVTAGESKGRSVQDPKPTPLDAGVKAFLSEKSLGAALRALVTDFPKEWAALPEEARQDADFVAFCEESFDKIEIALANARLLVSGGISDEALATLLEGES